MDRVDKHWQQSGLEPYSNEAIFGTLRHYGVAVDPARFLALAQAQFPLSIAALWHREWKGTGPFARFPASAAEELWRRLVPGAIAPTDVTLALVKLLEAMNDALQGKSDDGTWDARFRVLEAYLPRFPAERERRDYFVAEMVTALADWRDALDTMAEALAVKGLHAWSDRFVELEEALLPVRAGVARALVMAARGEKREAIAKLQSLAEDSTQEPALRLSAVDGLMSQEAWAQARSATLALMELAEQRRDVDLAGAAVHRLNAALKGDPAGTDRIALRARVQQLAQALSS